jgi:hypothetical protein
VGAPFRTIGAGEDAGHLLPLRRDLHCMTSYLHCTKSPASPSSLHRPSR